MLFNYRATDYFFHKTTASFSLLNEVPFIFHFSLIFLCINLLLIYTTLCKSYSGYFINNFFMGVFLLMRELIGKEKPS